MRRHDKEPVAANNELTEEDTPSIDLEQVRQAIKEDFPEALIAAEGLGDVARAFTEQGLVCIDEKNYPQAMRNLWQGMAYNYTLGQNLRVIARAACHFIIGPHIHGNQVQYWEQITRRRAGGQSASSPAE